MFSTSTISCSALSSAEAEETFNDLKKSFESFHSKIHVVGLEAKHKKTSKLTPNDDSRHVQLINLEP
jgi:hypothetical protein